MKASILGRNQQLTIASRLFLGRRRHPWFKLNLNPPQANETANAILALIYGDAVRNQTRAFSPDLLLMLHLESERPEVGSQDGSAQLIGTLALVENLWA